MPAPFKAFLALALAAPSLMAVAPKRTWDFGPFSYVRRTPAEAGAPPSAHPGRVDPDALGQALKTLRFTSGKTTYPVFAPPEAEALAHALAEALAEVGPGEDLQVLSTRNREGGILGTSTSVTARAFVRDARLQLIVRELRKDWLLAYNLDSRMPDFDFGTRSAASAVILSAPEGASVRPDWVALPLTAAKAETRPQPATILPPAPAPAPDPAKRATVEERLKDLKRFRDQGLITEEEYARQKLELLKEFSRTGN